jgi:MFS family permease
MQQDTLTAHERRLSLGAVIGGVFGVGVAFGAIVPLISLLLERRGISAFWIGANAAMFPVSLLLVGPLLPRFVAWLGTLRSMYLGIGVAAVLTLLFPLLPQVWVWFVLRFLIGIATGVHWVVSEAWINSISTDRDRGLIMGIYATVLAGGFAVGPLILSLIDVEGWAPFILVAVALALSAAPLVFARGVAPAMPERPGHGLTVFFATAPVVMTGAVVGGVVDSSLFSLLPIYGLRIGFEQATSVLLLTLFMSGNLMLQVPLGWIADRTNRLAIFFGCVGVALGGAVLLPLMTPGGVLPSVLLWPMLFLWGGTAFGIYTIGLSLLAEQFPREGLVGANTAFVMAYELGGLGGPIVAGGAMDVVGPHGLVIVVGATCAVFLLSIAARRRRNA